MRPISERIDLFEYAEEIRLRNHQRGDVFAVVLLQVMPERCFRTQCNNGSSTSSMP